MDIKVNFSGRAIKYTEEEIAVVVEAMRNAEPLTQGKHLQAFQKAFGEYIGAEHCFAVMNGVSALELSAQLCNFKPGDEVVIPSHTFTASAYPYAKKGAKLVWADVDPVTHVVNAETIEKCITPRTKAIVVVHLYGYVADMPAIMEVAKRHNVLVIEDAAQSIGADVDGIKSGAWGDMAIFSFHSHPAPQRALRLPGTPAQLLDAGDGQCGHAHARRRHALAEQLLPRRNRVRPRRQDA